MKDKPSQPLPALSEIWADSFTAEDVTDEAKAEEKGEEESAPRREISLSSTVNETTSLGDRDAKKESTSKESPTIFSDEEYRRRLESFNTGDVNILHDMMRFDPTELDRHVMEVLHAADTWMTQAPKSCSTWDTHSVGNEKDDTIQRYLKTKAIRPDLHAYVRERMKRIE